MNPIEKLVGFFGGQAKTAAALGVSQAAVSYWASGTYDMGAAKAFLAEELTRGAVTARELCMHSAKKSDASPGCTSICFEKEE
ncbi:Cro/CI family transcriptional regulator [Pseudomonas sp. SIMBA_041]|uniref:transcriptional regulator n=1 Tax=Pseudomonas sp. SIMBA_041 TaxID=3085782 RepID=UPI003978CCD4